jgi:hypothetical protein
MMQRARSLSLLLKDGRLFKVCARFKGTNALTKSAGHRHMGERLIIAPLATRARCEEELRACAVKSSTDKRAVRALHQVARTCNRIGVDHQRRMVERDARRLDCVGECPKLKFRGAERRARLRGVSSLRERAPEPTTSARRLAPQSGSVEFRDQLAECSARIVGQAACRECLGAFRSQPKEVAGRPERLNRIDCRLELFNRRGEIASTSLKIGHIALRDRSRQQRARAQIRLLRRDETRARFLEPKETQQRLAAIVFQLAKNERLVGERARRRVEPLQRIVQSRLPLQHDSKIDVGARQQRAIAPLQKSCACGVPFRKRLVEPSGFNKRVHRSQLGSRALLEQPMMPCVSGALPRLRERSLVLARVGKGTSTRAFGANLHGVDAARAGLRSEGG